MKKLKQLSGLLCGRTQDIRYVDREGDATPKYEAAIVIGVTRGAR